MTFVRSLGFGLVVSSLALGAMGCGGKEVVRDSTDPTIDNAAMSTGLDKDGKTVLRSIVGVDNVSFEGGRYTFKLNGYYGGQSLPATVLIRFNSASEMGGRGDGGQQGGGN